MRIKSNDRYFDFYADVEVEKQSKLFEAIDETSGDFSYQFDMEDTANNLSILGFPTADSVKSIYKSVPADLMDEDNIPMYTGQIKVEHRDIIGRKIICSFFSGNYNWISLLSGPLVSSTDNAGVITELGIDFSDLDTDLSEADIINSGTNTEGIFFPLIDTGGLITRGSANLVLQDFTGMIFLKTAFQRIFDSVGIKLQGDLIKDPIYNSALISRLTVDQKSVDDRSTYAGKTATQSFIVGNVGGITIMPPALVKVTFPDDSNFPFFDGSNNNYVPSTYTADVDMDLDVDVSLKTAYDNLGTGSAGDIFQMKIYVNGAEVYKASVTPPPPPPTVTTIGMKRNIRIAAGDTVEVYLYINPVVLPIPPNLGDTVYVYADSFVKFTPTFLFRTFGNSLLPKWTKAQFVNNVLSLFCCICDYEPYSKTLTIDFFNNLNSKEPIDLSEYVQIQTVDTSDFMADFAKRNLLKYADSDADAIKEYNIKYVEPYGSGVISVDNDFVPDSDTILDSEFKAPVSYINTIFSASLERVNFVEMEELDSVDFTSIQDSAGSARLNMATAQAFSRLQLCRISNCSIPEYNGDWLITTVSSTFIVIDRPFSVTATGTVTRLKHKYTNTDDVHIFIAATYDTNNVSRFSNVTSYQLVENNYTNISYAFFNMLNLGLAINDDYPQGLALGIVKNKISYQRTLLETYWPNVDNILADPVKLFSIGHIPKSVFMSLTPLRPIRISTLETEGLYYLNRITGYKKSHMPCTLELIKLS